MTLCTRSTRRATRRTPSPATRRSTGCVPGGGSGAAVAAAAAAATSSRRYRSAPRYQALILPPPPPPPSFDHRPSPARGLQVLKAGGLFAGYEWCLTDHYDSRSPVHLRAKDEIEIGNGLPEARESAAGGARGPGEGIAGGGGASERDGRRGRACIISLLPRSIPHPPLSLRATFSALGLCCPARSLVAIRPSPPPGDDLPPTIGFPTDPSSSPCVPRPPPPTFPPFLASRCAPPAR